MSEEYKNLSGAHALTVLYSGDHDRVPLYEVEGEPGVYSHFDVEGDDDVCDYFDLDFKPKEFDYFDMFANWFQVAARIIKLCRGDSLFQNSPRTIENNGPVIDTWRKPFKLSSFKEKTSGIVFLQLPLNLIKKGFFHYAQGHGFFTGFAQYEPPTKDCDFEAIKQNMLFFKSIVVAEEEGDDVLREYAEEHGVTLCLNFKNLVCSFVERDGEFYYRPIGKDYYVKPKGDLGAFYKPRPIMQVLDILTGLSYASNRETILLRLTKASFHRWLERGVDGYVMLWTPNRVAVAYDEPQKYAMSFYKK